MIREDFELELRVEDCLLQKDLTGLVSALHQEGLSRNLVQRLDHIVSKEMQQCGFRSVGLLLKSIATISETTDDLQLLLKHGMGTKVVSWFQTLQSFLTTDRYKDSVLLLDLSEEFCQYFLMVGQAAQGSGQSGQVIGVVLLQLGTTALESGMAFTVRIEAIKTFNSLVESLSREDRRYLQRTSQHCQLLEQMAGAILTVGDYSLQVSLSEALCRLTSKKERRDRANQWFSNEELSSAFCDIRAAEFEVDCRSFLNYFNSYHGDQRRVCTFPCVRAYLGTTELFRPEGEELEQFWIDFNLGSECVSFFVNDPQSFLWAPIHLLKEEVEDYSFHWTNRDSDEERTILYVKLSSPIMHQGVKGAEVFISFSPEHHGLLLQSVTLIFSKPLSTSSKPPLLPEALVAMETSSSGVQTMVHGHEITSCSTPSTPTNQVAVTSKPQEKAKVSPHREVGDGLIQEFACQPGGRTYHRKKAKSKLKILPMSSPSSGEDLSLTARSFLHSTPVAGRAELLFDQIRDGGTALDFSAKLTSTDSGFPETVLGESGEGEEDGLQSEHEEEPVPAVGSGSAVEKEVPAPERSTDGKRPADHSASCLNDALPAEPVGGLQTEGAEQKSNIMATFQSLTTKLAQSFTLVNHQIEVGISSVNDCRQQITSLLTAVSQHRLTVLDRCEQTIEQLTRLEETCLTLRQHILTFCRTEMEEQKHRLATLDSRVRDGKKRREDGEKRIHQECGEEVERGEEGGEKRRRGEDLPRI